jgi:murein DD-endopeptidase MepM/ murein hydrolase activator NlpD
MGRLALCLWVLAPSLAIARGEVRLQPAVARPGDAVLVTARGAADEPSGTLGPHALRFSPIDGGYQALSYVAVEAKPAALLLEVQLPGEENSQDTQVEGSLEVSKANFPERTLTVAGKYLNPPASVKKWMAEDKAAFAKAQAQKFGPRLFSGNFAWPVVTGVTATYGDLRLFNGKKQSQHFGTDLDGDVGDPIYATNDGVVVLSRECYASGGTVLVYHGVGLYSAYFHMSKRAVKAGEQVVRGQPLGQVGKSGRVTGPHLHFGIKIDGTWVDPESVLRLDFE